MFIILSCALLLDYLFSEPKKYHPLVGFGRLAEQLELRLNDHHIQHSDEQLRVNGFLAVLVCLIPAWFLTDFLTPDNFIGYAIEILIVYLAIGLSSLKQHARNIYEPLLTGQTDKAREALAMIVSRDTESMESEDIARATTESVLENGNDAVFAAIFWFMVAGAPGIVVYRLTNTLDAMWGYKNDRFKAFGYFVAKLDDLLNYIPARLTAVTYAFMGNWHHATKCWARQAPFWESPNAGVVMAAGAGALGVQLGGSDQYHGEIKERPGLGCGKPAEPQSIIEASRLLDRSTLFWLFATAVINLISF